MNMESQRPINPQTDEPLFDNLFSVASGTEMTGLIPTPAQTSSELSSYSEIFDVPLSMENSAEKKQNSPDSPHRMPPKKTSSSGSAPLRAEL